MRRRRLTSFVGLLSHRLPYQWMGTQSEQIFHFICESPLPLVCGSKLTFSFFFKSLSGPWSSQQDIAPPATNTYFSQNAYDLPLGSNAIYMGDRWRPDLLGSSRYIWYPLDFSSGSPQLVPADVWSVNIQAGTRFHFTTAHPSKMIKQFDVDATRRVFIGTYSAATGTSYEAENGQLGGSATIASDPSFSGGRVVGYLGRWLYASEMLLTLLI